MLLTLLSSRRRASGFSLIEILVGVAIGMLAMITIMQVFSLSEERKRNATSSGDAQSNGVIAFYQMQRDIGQAGYGFSGIDLFNCNLIWSLPSGTSIATAIKLAPVTINPPVSTIPAGDANTDTLLVVYGMGNGEPQGNVITTSTSTTYTVQMPTSFAVGDKVISAPAACGTTNRTLGSITSVGVSTVSVASAQSGATLYNLGLTPSILAYAIRNQNLTVCDFLINDCGLDANKTNASIWIPIAANIVSLRAVYWQDTSSVMDGIPDSDGHTQILPTTACGWARASAINFALVARSDQYTKDPIAPTITMVTNTAVNHAVSPFPVINAPAWVENATAPMVGATGTLGPDTALDEPWKHYRYKVFQAVTPIRNVAWMGVPTGC